MTAPAADTYTERGAFADILQWSAGQPVWQQDALRRLIETGAAPLDEAAIDELVALCLDPKLAATPLAKEHLTGGAAVGQAISLVSISQVAGVNALAAGQNLEFAPTGLTVVYGDNGSGKSGYVRVLKHACRSRDDDNAILRDIQDTSGTPQSATITFARGGSNDTFNWTPTTAHDELPAVSIFDSRSANIHVEKTNAVAYNPYPMQVMAALADVCDRVKQQIAEKIDALEQVMPLSISQPTLPEGTTAGDFLRSLSAKTNPKTVTQLATLTDAEKSQLATLDADLSQDPKLAAAKVRALLTRLEKAASAVKAAAEASGDNIFTRRTELQTARDAAAEAAAFASKQLFAASPLPDVGGAIWRNLWEAARKYSETVAYAGRTFPVDQAGQDRCVLCQQQLDDEAVKRQATFEAFIKGTTKADETKATQSYQDFLKSKLATVTMRNVADMRLLLRDELGDAGLADALCRCAIAAAARLRAFRREAAPPVAASVYPQAEIDRAIVDLRKRLDSLGLDANSPERLASLATRDDLRARDELGLLEADIKAHIDRLKQIAALEKASKTAAKRAVTLKNKEISDKLVTDTLRGRFVREIDKLKLSRMPVELRKIKDQTAVSFFRVCLVEKPDSDVGQIFSEGEHRCVALAAFMAELVTSQQYSGIVFDDPMSSLDHIHRRAVAARLIEEAQHRQVIVFTHDLTFLFELRREADAKQHAVHWQTVCRKTDRPGFIEGELPSKAKSAMQLAGALRVELKAAKGQFDQWSDMKRTLFCKGVIEQLREAWDQGIADFIFPVLGRFDNTIKGNSLFKLAVLTEQDVVTVTDARARLSEDLHVSAETLNPEQVSRDALVAEVGKLEGWLQDMADRQKAAILPSKSLVTS